MESLRQSEPGRGRVLLVEDDPAVRRSLQLLLTGHGYEVRAYPSGQGLDANPEALRTDCLVADLVIADANALSLLRDLRRAGWVGRAVLISGQLTDEWTARALGAGFDAVFAKPLRSAALAACLGKLMPAQPAPSAPG